MYNEACEIKRHKALSCSLSTDGNFHKSNFADMEQSQKQQRWWNAGSWVTQSKVQLTALFMEVLPYALLTVIGKKLMLNGVYKLIPLKLSNCGDYMFFCVI